MSYTFAISVRPSGLVIWASALHKKCRGFNTHAGTFLDFFFYRGICCVGVDLCYLSSIVKLWDEKRYLLSPPLSFTTVALYMLNLPLLQKGIGWPISQDSQRVPGSVV